VELSEVFVEPMLSNKSSFNRDTEDRKTLFLNDLLKSDLNLLLAGRPEFGKTTILRYAKEFILRQEKHFETKIPVSLRFGDLSKSNVKAIIRHIAKALRQTEMQVESFASLGQLTLLIDDFNDRQDINHEKRVAILRHFLETYPKCRLYTLIK